MEKLGIHYCLGLSAVLFSIGVVGVITRRNALLIFMSVEIMLNAVNLSFVALAKELGSLDGQVAAIFVITVAGAEVAVGLSIIVALFRKRETVDVDQIDLMKW